VIRGYPARAANRIEILAMITCVFSEMITPVSLDLVVSLVAEVYLGTWNPAWYVPRWGDFKGRPYALPARGQSWRHTSGQFGSAPALFGLGRRRRC
jgi:hypothetical protein